MMADYIMYEESTDTPEHKRIFKTRGRIDGTQLYMWIHYDRMKGFELYDGPSDALVYDGKEMKELTVGNDSRHSENLLFKRDQPIDLDSILSHFKLRSKNVPQLIKSYVIEKIEQYTSERSKSD